MFSISNNKTEEKPADSEYKDPRNIPNYIIKTPWYLLNEEASKSKKTDEYYEKQQAERNKRISELECHKKGQMSSSAAATKYRKGACENCGALTHKTKECLDRPRKLGAKWTGKDIKPDEYVQNAVLDYDGKRDRWNGYDPEEYKEFMEDWQELDAKRKELLAQTKANTEKDDKSALLSDDEKYAEAVDMPGQKVELDSKSRMTIRNLRLREDTAKYLLNLNLNSAYYDPKTRSMRENPFPDKNPELVPFAGENYYMKTGDVDKIKELQVFAWQAAEEKGAGINLQATPSQTELLHKKYTAQKREEAEKQKQELLQRYGGEEHRLYSVPEIATSDVYVEYNQNGAIVKSSLKNTETASSVSKYPEDVYPNNHKAVWGSFWRDFQWGFACCHSFILNSFCTGQAGIAADLEAQSRKDHQSQLKLELDLTGEIENSSSFKESESSSHSNVPSDSKFKRSHPNKL